MATGREVVFSLLQFDEVTSLLNLLLKTPSVNHRSGNPACCRNGSGVSQLNRGDVILDRGVTVVVVCLFAGEIAIWEYCVEVSEISSWCLGLLLDKIISRALVISGSSFSNGLSWYKLGRLPIVLPVWDVLVGITTTLFSFLPLIELCLSIQGLDEFDCKSVITLVGSYFDWGISWSNTSLLSADRELVVYNNMLESVNARCDWLRWREDIVCSSASSPGRKCAVWEGSVS